MWRFYYFNIERNYDVLNSKSLRILLKENMKKKTENKTQNGIENRKFHTQLCETKLVLQFIQKTKIKSKIVMSWSSQKKKEGIFL